MKTSIKTLLLSSIVGFSSLSFAMADEPGERYSHHGMMHGTTPWWDEEDHPCYGTMHGYGMGSGYGMGMNPGYGMGPGYGMMHGYGMGYGMMPGYGMGMSPRYGMGYGMMMDLSESQLKQMDQIRMETSKQQRELMKDIWKQRRELARLMSEQSRDSNAIGQAFDRLSDLKRQALENRIKMTNKMQDVLTPEQKQQMRRGERQGMMGWGMMGY